MGNLIICFIFNFYFNFTFSLYFVLSGVGVKGLDHPEYMDEAFTNSESIWKVASWHKNQRKMQM